jgi:hypothetical protein
VENRVIEGSVKCRTDVEVAKCRDLGMSFLVYIFELLVVFLREVQPSRQRNELAREKWKASINTRPGLGSLLAFLKPDQCREVKVLVTCKFRQLPEL